MVKQTRFKALFTAPYLGWTVLFILVPLLMVFWYGFTTDEGAFTLSNLASIADPVHLKALGLSVLLSVGSSVICLLLAYPLCLILASRGGNAKSIIVMIIILPMWMNSLLRILAWQTILERSGLLNALLSFLHLPTLSIINTPYAIMLGMVYDFLPFMILPIYNVLSKIDKNLLNAARDLGANSLQTFLKVTLPLSVPGIMSGITMVFIPALTTFVISQILGGSKILLIGNVIEQEFTQAYDWHLGSGLSVILMIFIVINMIMETVFNKSGEDLTL